MNASEGVNTCIWCTISRERAVLIVI